MKKQNKKIANFTSDYHRKWLIDAIGVENLKDGIQE